MDGLPPLQTTNSSSTNIQIKKEAGAETPLPPTPTESEFPSKLELKEEIKPIIPLQKPRNSGRPTWKLPGKPEPTNQMWAQTIEQDPPEIQMQQNNNNVNSPLEPAKACRVLIHKPSVSNNKKQMMNDFYLLWDRGNVTCSRTDIIFEPREGSSFYHKRTIPKINKESLGKSNCLSRNTYSLKLLPNQS